jgi:HK97 family phage major capsid protein
MSFLNKQAAPMAALAKSLMLARGEIGGALEIAKSRHALPEVTSFLKSAVAAGTTTDGQWASSLSEYRSISDGFLGSLGEFSAFDRILGDSAFKSVPLRTRVTITSAAMTASLVGERVAKPIQELELETTQLAERKCAGVLVVSDELLRFGGAGSLNLLNSELRRAVAIASDLVFLDVLQNSTAINTFASTGLDATHFPADLAGALDNLQFGSDARLYIIAPAETIKMIAMMRGSGGAPVYPDATVVGGSISGIPLVASDAATDLLIVDASQVAASSGPIVLDASAEAAVELSNSPTASPTEMVSLWQRGLRGLRAERVFGAELLRPTACVGISGVTA